MLPLLYGICFVGLLWQAFRVMARGFGAASGGSGSAMAPSKDSVDRTGKLTIHPELLNADGELTREDLLTVRFEDEPRPSTE
ncbi:MAG: DUF2973 domain-containing protein [Cyanobacteriota bacterium]|nr:DUF2973 domain-containing protein [Cyanobacteriota bacterium]